jgi:hypothetical protein
MRAMWGGLGWRVRGGLTEAQRHGGLAGGGFSQSRKVAKGGGAGWWDHEIHEWHEKGRYWSYSYASVVVLVLSAAVLGLRRSGTRIAAQRYSDRGGAGLGIWGECDWGECDWGEWLSGDGGGFVEGTL